MNLPPLPVLHGTLRRITERLAGELAQPTEVAPDWSDLEWQLARAVAAMHGVSPLLATQLRWQGPPQWQPFLTSQRAHVASRHRRIDQAAGAGEVLESLGFSEVPASANWKHKVFMPRMRDMPAQLGEHSQNYLKFELHERIAEILPLRPLDVTAAIYPRRPHPGLNAYPSNVALLIHLLIHAASAMAYRALRLLHLHDIALVAGRMTHSDWHELLVHGRDCGGPWWALPPIQLTKRYYPMAVPAPVLTELQAYCQWNLRRLARRQTLSDVSLSYLWIEAFPGIGWSRSLSEMLECMRSRIRPTAETRRLRTAIAQTEVASSNSEWTRLSQGQRILRWIVSRQPRPDTLHAVRTALAQPQ
jgi:hypothetical protein